jgi:hypothetical protein
MKKIIICGASDCFLDPDFPNQSWMERLQAKLPDYSVETLAVEGASNFFIRLQIDRAIEQQADYIIVNFTSSIREEIKFNDIEDDRDLYDRFYRYHATKEPTSLVCYSPATLDKTSILTTEQKQILKSYYVNFSNMDLSVQKNYYFIQNSIETLIKKKIPFKFSQGGFEHSSYMDDLLSNYSFEEYQTFQSKYNLWDYIDDFKRARPYFHIDNPEITQEIADYYAKEIKNNAAD